PQDGIDLVGEVHDAGRDAGVGDLVGRGRGSHVLRGQASDDLPGLETRDLIAADTARELRIARCVEGDTRQLCGALAKRAIQLADSGGDSVAPDRSMELDRSGEREAAFG